MRSTTSGCRVWNRKQPSTCSSNASLKRAGATAMVVFHVDDGTVNDPATAAAIDATITEVASLEHVLAVTDPLAGPRSISPDGSTAFAAVQFDGSTADLSAAPRWTNCSTPPRPRSRPGCRSNSAANSRPC
jgi:hypothetical protein